MIFQAASSGQVLHSNYQRNDPAANPRTTEAIHIAYISEVIDYINKNYNKDISLEEITRCAYLSKFHFCRIFKKHTSYSPYQYLLLLRLNHSKRLLSTTTYSVSEIADMCGFKRLDYFSAMFRKRFNCNPSQYRAHLLQMPPVGLCFLADLIPAAN